MSHFCTTIFFTHSLSAIALPIRFWYVLCVVVGFCSVCWLDGGAVLKSEFYNAVFIYFHSLICRFYVLPFHPEYEATFCRAPLQREYNNYITAPTICLCSSSYQSLFHKWTFPKKLGFIYFSRENFLNVKIWFFFFFSWKWQAKDEIHSWMSLAPFYNCTIRESERERDEDVVRIAVLHSHHQPYIRGWLSITARSLWIGITFSSLFAS